MTRRPPITIIVISCLLAACVAVPKGDRTAEAGTSTPLPAPTCTPRPTSTPSNSMPSTATPAPTATYIGPTPSLPAITGKDFYFGDFFFDSDSSPDCQFPCWHGLVLGQSKPGDFQQFMDTEFGFNGTTDFFADNPPSLVGLGILGVEGNSVPGTYARGYAWTATDPVPMGTFYLVAGFDESSDVMQILGFKWHTSDSLQFEIRISPERVIEEMGVPQHMLASALPGPSGSLNTLLMMYETGIVFKFISEGPLDFNEEMTEVFTDFCLGNTKTQSGVTTIGGSVYLFEPFTNESYQSPLYNAIVVRSIRWNELVLIQEVFGVTSEEVGQQVLKKSNVCLRSNNIWDD